MPVLAEGGVEHGAKGQEFIIHIPLCGSIGMGDLYGNGGLCAACIHAKEDVVHTGLIVDPIDAMAIGTGDGTHILAKGGPECLTLT